MKVYYAHSIHLYNTPQEQIDIELLTKLGFEVVNPNSVEVDIAYKEYKSKYGDDKAMDYFRELIDDCAILAFRSHVDNKIPSGVGYEIKYAITKSKLIIELPNFVSNRFLSLEDTREYLKLLGKR